MKTMRLLPLVLAAGALFASRVSAQEPRSSTQGFHLAASLNRSALRVEDSDDVESGGGLSAEVGYGVSRTVTLLLGVTGAEIEGVDEEDYGMAHVDLAARIHFRQPTARWIPYLKGALTGRATVFDVDGDDLTYSGSGITVGGGVAFFLTRRLALDAGLTATVGKFKEAEFLGVTDEIDLQGTSTRFDLGVNWWAGG